MSAISASNEAAQPDLYPAGGRFDQFAPAIFGTWMIVGLFLDGWAHIHDKPETFFSPWHGVLYSGFAAAVISIAISRRRRQAAGEVAPLDRLLAVGIGVFIAGGMSDAVWHQIFGVEVDLDALLSPSHLLLMTGGLLMLTSPLRLAEHGRSPSFVAFLPIAVSLTLTVALASFFLMYLSAFHPYPGGTGDLALAHTVGSVLITNAMLLAPLLYVLRRWHPPAGTATLLFTGVAVLMSGLSGFSQPALVVPSLLAGVTADVYIQTLRAGPDRLPQVRGVAVAVPVVLWAGWFVVQATAYTQTWQAEMVGGSITLAALSGLGLSLLVFPHGDASGSPQQTSDARSNAG